MLLSFVRKFKHIGILAILALVAVSSAQAEMLRMGMITPPPHIWNNVAEHFADDLLTSSDKNFRTKIFPLGKLGGEQQMIDMLQSGGIQMAVLTAGVLSNRESSISGWFMPGMFADIDAAINAAASSSAQEMLRKLSDHQLVGLGYTMAGMRHVLSREQIDSLQAFENRKVRSFPNEVFNDWWQGLHAAPTAMPLSEVTPALNTNLLDIVDVDLDIVVGLKLYQQAPNLLLTNHMAFPGIIVASKPWWDSLSDQQRAMISASISKAQRWGFDLTKQREQESVDTLKGLGVNIESFEMSKLQTVMDAVVKKYTSSNSGIAEFYLQNTQ